MSRETTCCFTGHRVLGRDFEFDRLYRTIIKLIEKRGIDTFISGGAMGFDTYASEAVLKAKENGYNVQLYLYLPCNNQTEKWAPLFKIKYEEILKRADYIDMVDRPYFEGCMQERNYKMVDASAFCLCYFNGKPSGTGQTVRYAQKCGLEVGNLYGEFSSL